MQPSNSEHEGEGNRDTVDAKGRVYKRKQELDANDSDESSADSIFGDEQTTTTRCGGQGLGAVELKPTADDERAAERT
jgi:hypothetical protein